MIALGLISYHKNTLGLISYMTSQYAFNYCTLFRLQVCLMANHLHLITALYSGYRICLRVTISTRSRVFNLRVYQICQVLLEMKCMERNLTLGIHYFMHLCNVFLPDIQHCSSMWTDIQSISFLLPYHKVHTEFQVQFFSLSQLPSEETENTLLIILLNAL